ncbi:MAG: hypothetical protein JXR51_02180 [Bacteroidales bacterium]|nr:hypothetical protein [Bacteroidales bacterium]MBN2755955.1 hypothetical protein [Bacteroidales bacterium]
MKIKSIIFKSILIIFLLIKTINISIAQNNELFNQNKTLTYEQIIQEYKNLDKKYENAKLIEAGISDAGKPIHLFIISDDKEFNPEQIKKDNKRILLINNGIHPGESCGIDASIKFSEDLLSGNLNQKKYLSNTVICIIPVYNVGGCINRGPYSRMNQIGPEQHGFRGNAKNLDLNRDFIKSDAENSKTFAKIFHIWQPDVFVDTHTSNGADYQYVITLISTNTDKFHKPLASYVDNNILPFLYSKMIDYKYEMTPYVNPVNEIPDSGIVGFFDSPRYASGYTSLFNTISFITETHMLKPYKDRVLSTYYFILAINEFLNKNNKQIADLKKDADEQTSKKHEFTINWKLDKTQIDSLLFKGFAAKYKKSNITGFQRLYYDKTEPFEKNIAFYKHYKPEKTIKKPEYYIISQAWQNAIDRLKLNNVKLKTLKKDTSIMVSAFIIDDFKTKEAYENHYLHYEVKTHTDKQLIEFYKGDYIVETNQKENNYIINTLEPDATDSYFVWNFFDAVLQQKEWFSAYVFEETAEKILEEHPDIKEELEKAKLNDKNLAENHYWQLLFIYRRSKYFEKSFMRYPVYRIEEKIEL